MGAEPSKKTDRQKMISVLIPAGMVASIIILVGIILATSDSGTVLDKKGGTSETTLSDGTDVKDKDANLQDIGDGLKYRDLKVGDGPEAVPGATVKVNYTGWLTNGKVFDSSKKAGKPYVTSLNRVVAGWKLGIPGMKVGGIRKLVIPSHLGYGADGSPPDIPPNATLVFEVELLDVK